MNKEEILKHVRSYEFLDCDEKAWAFYEEELLAFVQWVIEEDRKSEDWPVQMIRVPVEIFAKLRKHKVSVDDLVDAIKQVDVESSDEPVGDFGLVMELCAALEIASYSIQDEEAKQSTIGACNYGRNRVKDRRPAPARKPLSDEEIRTIMLGNGFTIKDGCEDLKPYVYAAVRAIEKAHGIGDAR